MGGGREPPKTGGGECSDVRGSRNNRKVEDSCSWRNVTAFIRSANMRYERHIVLAKLQHKDAKERDNQNELNIDESNVTGNGGRV
jgi:uncharacterized metal-binding protein